MLTGRPLILLVCGVIGLPTVCEHVVLVVGETGQIEQLLHIFTDTVLQLLGAEEGLFIVGHRNDCRAIALQPVWCAQRRVSVGPRRAHLTPGLRLYNLGLHFLFRLLDLDLRLLLITRIWLHLLIGVNHLYVLFDRFGDCFHLGLFTLFTSVTSHLLETGCLELFGFC